MCYPSAGRMNKLFPFLFSDLRRMQFTFWVVVVTCVLLHSRDCIGNDQVDPLCENKKQGKIVDVQKSNVETECTIGVCFDGKVVKGLVKDQTRECGKLLSEWERIGGSAGNEIQQKSCSYREKTYENMSMFDVSKKGSMVCVNGKIIREFSVAFISLLFGIEAWVDL